MTAVRRRPPEKTWEKAHLNFGTMGRCAGVGVELECVQNVYVNQLLEYFFWQRF
jgi:hypothetical protein